MRCTILQPGYLPWLGFFNQMALSDVFVFFDDVQYDRRGWRNRNRIKSTNGPIWLTVPVIQHGKFDQDLLDTRIDNSSKWARKHIRSIEFNYRSAPFFDLYFPKLNSIISSTHDLLIDLDLHLLHAHMEWFGLDSVRTVRSSELPVANRDKTGRLVDICRLLGVSEYISGPLCRDYMEIDQFDKAGIQVLLHDFSHPEYPQIHGNFIPFMAAIDALFNCGPNARSLIGNAGSLVRFSEYKSGD
ncbi:MAG TPA: WbqC family protein [bacterium]|nr:WbqC family protein [bacterium]